MTTRLRLSCAWIAAVLLSLGSTGPSPAHAQTSASTNPLLGSWRLNLERTRYGSGVERRSQETFVCDARGKDVRCSIQGTRADGRRVAGGFTVAMDGKAGVVTGLPDIDHVTVTSPGNGVVDATFTSHGVAVFGYRAFRSEDGRSLSIVTVIPDSRVVLGTLVVYDRQ